MKFGKSLKCSLLVITVAFLDNGDIIHITREVTQYFVYFINIEKNLEVGFDSHLKVGKLYNF